MSNFAKLIIKCLYTKNYMIIDAFLHKIRCNSVATSCSVEIF